MQPIIEAHALTRRFGPTVALDGLDLVAERGQVTAVLGPNGAGKSTFVRAVATLVRPDAGRLAVAGVDAIRHPEEVRRRIGLAGQHAAVDDALTGRENLELVARLFGLDRRAARAAAGRVLERLGLADDADRSVRGYSGGMRRRLDLGASLVGEPHLLLLDEPTTGLDPRSRSQLWATIRDLIAGGTDVLLTTQYLEEADQLADRVVIVDRGRAIATGSPAELKRRAGRDVLEVRAASAAELDAVRDIVGALAAEPPRVDPASRRVTAALARGTDGLREAVLALEVRRIPVDDIGLRRPTLDEVFLALTGHGAGEPAGVGS